MLRVALGNLGSEQGYEMTDISLSFFGGAGTVTGSKYLVNTGFRRILVDCGMFQGLKTLRDLNWKDLPFRPADLDAVVLTHAHIDHSGYLPRLVKMGYRGPIYISEGTGQLLEILLHDAGRLQEEDADHRKLHGLTRHRPAKPLYTEQDAFDALRLIRPISGPDQTIKLFDNATVRFMNAGHIAGSRFVVLKIDEQAAPARTILFSGDIGQYDRPLLPDPENPPVCDYLLVESTYGDRLHPSEKPADALARIITEAAKRNGPILIPAFAVDRTQEILYILRELEDSARIPILPVRVDSPMAAAATVVYGRLKAEQDAEYRRIEASGRRPLFTRNMMIASTREDSKRINDEDGARIIISAAGMMTGGRVLHHAQRVLPDPNATLVFVGYQGEGTTGRLILDGAKEVTIYQTPCVVRCRVESVDGLSSHANWQDTIHWLSGMPGAPRCTFITHGEPESASALKEHIETRFHWKVVIPRYGDRFILGDEAKPAAIPT